MYRQVAEALLRDVKSGKYRPGQKLPSEAALVKRFGTSRITIGRALRELKLTGLIHGVAGAGNFVQSVSSNGALKGEFEEPGLLFGLLIPNLGQSEIFEPICQGIASASQSGTYALLWGHTPGTISDPEKQAIHLCKQFIAQKAAGVFFAPLELTPNKDAVNQNVCSMLDAAQIPVILLDRCILPFPQRSKYDLVGIDNRRAGYLAAEHLLKAGMKKVAFVGLPGAAPTVEARIAGYREALTAHDIALDSNLVQRLSVVSAETVSECLQKIKPDAVVCANDQVAGQFLHALQELGCRIPQDIRVVGIDDLEYARLLPVPLTTVHQPCRAIGEAAMAAMIQRRQQPDQVTRDVLLECTLVVRRSSRP